MGTRHITPEQVSEGAARARAKVSTRTINRFCRLYNWVTLTAMLSEFVPEDIQMKLPVKRLTKLETATVIYNQITAQPWLPRPTGSVSAHTWVENRLAELHKKLAGFTIADLEGR